MQNRSSLSSPFFSIFFLLKQISLINSDYEYLFLLKNYYKKHQKLLLYSCLMLSIQSVSIAQNWGNAIKITASDRKEGDSFGFDIAISDGIAAIGAPFEGGKGAAYIYYKNEINNSWEEVKKITASDGEFGDRFGWSVSINGDYIIVGANSKNNSTGAAYIYNRNKIGEEWGEVKKITASDGISNDFFGASVSINGNYAIVGAFGNNLSLGAAYIFYKNKVDGVWGQIKKLTASNQGFYDTFGASVSINGDYAIVGADGANEQTGAAYIFYKNKIGEEWGQIKKLMASDQNILEAFGSSVSISENYAIVGAFRKNNSTGAAYIFDKNKEGEKWGEVKKLMASDGVNRDQFGFAVAISGTYALIGAYNKNKNIGAAYIYDKDETINGSEWGQIKKLHNNLLGEENDYFGYSVAIDSLDMIVGAWGENENAMEQNSKMDAGGAYFYNNFCSSNYNISDSLLEGRYSSTNWIETTTSRPVCIIGSTSFTAGISILLKSGFHAKAGNNFWAKITDCNVKSNSSLSSLSTVTIKEKERKKHLINIFPNPSDLEITLQYKLINHSEVSIQLYNNLGIKIANLIDKEYKPKGTYSIEYYNPSLPNGIYYLNITIGGERISKKLILQK